MGWTADEFYGQNAAFLNALDDRDQAFVVEIPGDVRVWTRKPKVLRKPGENEPERQKKFPRLNASQKPPSEVRNLARHSPAFHEQAPQRYPDFPRSVEIRDGRKIVCRVFEVDFSRLQCFGIGNVM
jgi:DDE superfamily endonuclease